MWCGQLFILCNQGIVEAPPEVTEEESTIILESFKDRDWLCCRSQQCLSEGHKEDSVFCPNWHLMVWPDGVLPLPFLLVSLDLSHALGSHTCSIVKQDHWVTSVAPFTLPATLKKTNVMRWDVLACSKDPGQVHQGWIHLCIPPSPLFASHKNLESQARPVASK